MGPSRVYNPLNGVEVKTLILREIEAAFAEVSDFRESVPFRVTPESRKTSRCKRSERISPQTLRQKR